jgi:hypothetical protein
MYCCMSYPTIWSRKSNFLLFVCFFIQGGVKVAWHDLISSFLCATVYLEKGNQVRAMYIISDYLLVLKWVSSFAPLGMYYKGCRICSSILYRVLLSVLGKRGSWQNWLRGCRKNTDNGFVVTVLIRALNKNTNHFNGLACVIVICIVWLLSKYFMINGCTFKRNSVLLWWHNHLPMPVAARLLGLRVRILPGAWMSVSCVCIVR